MTTNSDIHHSPEQQKFTLAVAGTEAVLEYRLLPSASEDKQPATINFTHTYVPPELRGRGLAESLVRHGLKWARAQGYQIRASCWYVNKFLR